MTSTVTGNLLRSLAALAVGLCLGSTALAQTANPKDYPTLSDKELGQIRHLIKLSNNLPGDWAGFGGNGEWEATEHHLQFHSSFAIMALAMAQQQQTPAYREWYKKAIQNYIKKLTHVDIWERWGAMSSRGGSFGRQQQGFQPGWFDPVGKDNNMYKGYLAMSGTLYEMLYGDARYQQPGAFTFKQRYYAFSNGRITFRYTLDDIVKNLHQEVVDSNYLGAACEPGLYYWACNGASNAVFILYDHLHGTHYADVVPKVKEAWIRNGGLNPATFTVGMEIQTKLDDRTKVVAVVPAVFPYSSAYSGPWSGLFNNAWDSAFVKAAYYGPDGIDRNEALKYYLSGDWARSQVDPTRYSDRWQLLIKAYNAAPADLAPPAFKSLYWGFFLAYAAEVGDREGVNKMLDYAERNYGPVWENGEYFYPRSDDYSVDAQGNTHGLTGWTGNVLLTLGRLDKGDGFRKLYQQPWTDAERNTPEITGIDSATTNVSQAWWDASKKALIVTLQPGPIKAPQTSFSVIRLDPNRHYSVSLDGKAIGTIAPGGTLAKGAIRWKSDTLSVSGRLPAKHSWVFVESGA